MGIPLMKSSVGGILNRVRNQCKIKHIPLEKQSKRAQKENNNKQRGSWNGVVPVTRVIPNKKAYDRKRVKQEEREFRMAAF